MTTNQTGRKFTTAAATKQNITYASNKYENKDSLYNDIEAKCI